MKLLDEIAVIVTNSHVEYQLQVRMYSTQLLTLSSWNQRGSRQPRPVTIMVFISRVIELVKKVFAMRKGSLLVIQGRQVTDMYRE